MSVGWKLTRCEQLRHAIVILSPASFQVAPGGQADLLQRADIDQGGTLSSSEFIVLGNLLGLSDANALQLFGSLRLVENHEIWGKNGQGH